MDTGEDGERQVDSRRREKRNTTVGIWTCAISNFCHVSLNLQRVSLVLQDVLSDCYEALRFLLITQKHPTRG